MRAPFNAVGARAGVAAVFFLNGFCYGSWVIREVQDKDPTAIFLAASSLVRLCSS